MFFLEAVCAKEIYPIVNLIKLFLNVLRIAVPIILILFITIDLVKAVISGSDDEFKKSQKIILKRGIYAIATFLTVTLVTVVMNIIANAGVKDLSGNDMDVQTWKACWQCEKGDTVCQYSSVGTYGVCCSIATADGQEFKWYYNEKTCKNNYFPVDREKESCSGFVPHPSGVCCSKTSEHSITYSWYPNAVVCPKGYEVEGSLKKDTCQGGRSF